MSIVIIKIENENKKIDNGVKQDCSEKGLRSKHTPIVGSSNTNIENLLGTDITTQAKRKCTQKTISKQNKNLMLKLPG